LVQLTHAELNIAQLVSLDKSNKDIAAQARSAPNRRIHMRTCSPKRRHLPRAQLDLG
jgi:hypothetical protein